MHADLLPDITLLSEDATPRQPSHLLPLQLQQLSILPPTTNLNLLFLLELPSLRFRLLAPRTLDESQAIDPQALVATSSRGPSALTTTPESPRLMFSAPAKM
jgi:hypothetical protein